MKTETREERTLETPMVEDDMRQSLPPPMEATARVLLLSKGHGKASSLWWNGCVTAKGVGKVRNMEEWW